jgi:hypothetical protein
LPPLYSVAAAAASAVVLPGYFAQWDAAGFAYNADECAFGTYWPGGQISGPTPCTSCGGYTTATVASKAKSACAAPPGYYLPNTPGASQMLLCPSSIAAASYGIHTIFGTFGTYRAGWATTPNGVKDCQICGANVLSEATKENQHPADSLVELVASSPDACCECCACSATDSSIFLSLAHKMRHLDLLYPGNFAQKVHLHQHWARLPKKSY